MFAVHVAPQAMPAGIEVTVPAPVPALVMVTAVGTTCDSGRFTVSIQARSWQLGKGAAFPAGCRRNGETARKEERLVIAPLERVVARRDARGKGLPLPVSPESE